MTMELKESERLLAEAKAKCDEAEKKSKDITNRLNKITSEFSDFIKEDTRKMLNEFKKGL